MHLRGLTSFDVLPSVESQALRHHTFTGHQIVRPSSTTCSRSQSGWSYTVRIPEDDKTETR